MDSNHDGGRGSALRGAELKVLQPGRTASGERPGQDQRVELHREQHAEQGGATEVHALTGGDDPQVNGGECAIRELDRQAGQEEHPARVHKNVEDSAQGHEVQQ